MPDISSRLALCSWSLGPRDPADLIARVRETDLNAVQLGLNPLHADPENWGDAIKQLQHAEICIVSGMFGTVGEDYSTLEAIARTGGVVPDEHWPENQRIIEGVASIAAENNLAVVSFHAGFIPHDETDPTFVKLLERIRWIADRFAQDTVEVLFETGQETAEDLLAFLEALDRPNVGVNFDPANMILYGKGEPVEALRKLMPRVRQVHVKDATASDKPGETWGAEVPVGEGEVDWRAFMQTLDEGGYTGPLVIEREAGAQRVADIRKAANHLRRVAAQAGN